MERALAVCNSPAVLRAVLCVCAIFANAACEVDAHPAVGLVPATFMCPSAAMVTTRRRRSEAGNKLMGQHFSGQDGNAVKQRNPAEVDTEQTI